MVLWFIVTGEPRSSFIKSPVEVDGQAFGQRPPNAAMEVGYDKPPQVIEIIFREIAIEV